MEVVYKLKCAHLTALHNYWNVYTSEFPGIENCLSVTGALKSSCN